MMTPVPAEECTASAALREHPMRRTLFNEVHARPYEALRAPVRASHLAVTTGENSLAACRAHVAALCDRFGAPPPAPGATHFSGQIGPVRLRWEPHAEFVTFTIYRFDEAEDPFAATALELVPRDWLESLPGECLVALHVAVEARERGAEELARFFDGNLIMGSEVLSGAARAWTDFRMHDGFGRFLVADHGLLPGQAGRLVQRLLEIETYRMMALLAFPLARETQPRISTVDAGLSEIIHRMAEGTAGDSDRALLERLTALAAEVERISAATTYRFSASRAYYGLVERRIRELREERLAGTQTIGEFMERRLGPAMATCLSTAERHEALSRRIARAGDLLRTRVDIALEEKNRDLLLSMNRRAALQLRLQETVEGLSVVAISYYLLGLLGYLAKGAKAAGVPINPDLAVFLSFPVLVAMIWLGVKRLRKAIVAEEEGHE